MKPEFITGIAAICTVAAVTANAANRLWNPADEANKNLADGENWNPAFGTDDISADELAINCTTNATLATDFSTKTLYVGKGSTINDAGEWANSIDADRGAKLDVSAGTLALTNLWVGGGYADYRDCILNLSGTGKIDAYYFKTGDCASRTDDGSGTNIRHGLDNMKANYVNIGTGTEVTTHSTELSTYDYGTTYLTISENAKWTNESTFYLATKGKATVTVDGGSLTAKRISMCDWGLTTSSGTLIIKNGGTVTTAGENPEIGRGSGTTGTVHIANGTLASGNDIFVGVWGTGILTIDNGGTASCKYYCNFNRDASSTAEGSTINLNAGGTLNVGVIHSSGSGRAAFNWNGGVFKPFTRDDGGFYEYIFEDVSKYDVNVLRNGAILDTNGKSRSISATLEGEGFFEKRGDETCWIKHAADLKRGVRVVGGTLVFEQGFATASSATNPVKEIYVAEGKSLDLKGNISEKPTIYVSSYTRNGVLQSAGTYDDYGATIIVIENGATVATATWTGDADDGDTANSDNWLCYNADGVLIYDALPTADSIVTVPFEDAALFDGYAAAEIIVVATGDISLNSAGADCDNYSYSGGIKASGNLKIANGQTSVLRKAEVWYDPSDADTVTADGEGKVTAIANKGYRGAEMDAAAIDSSSVPVVSEEGKINGRTALVFNGERGFKAAGTIPSAVDQPRYIFGVAKTVYVDHDHGENTCNHDDTQFMLIDCRNGNENDGRFYLRKNGINGYDLCPEMYAVKTDSTTGYFRGGNRPNVWNSYGYAYSMILTNGNMSVLGWQDGNASDQGGDNAYASLTASSSGTVGVWYGEGADGHKTTDGNMIGEALVFVDELSNSEIELVRNYLKHKWTTSTGATAYDGATTLASLDLNGNTVDFDGANVAITNLYGSGVISNGTVTAIGTLNIVVNSDGTANKVVIPNGLNVAGMKVNITGIRNLKRGQAAVVLEPATGALTGAIAAADVTADDANVRYRLKVNADGKLELSKAAGLIILFK